MYGGAGQSGGHCLPFEVTDFNECVNEAGRTHTCRCALPLVIATVMRYSAEVLMTRARTCSPDAICSNTLGSFTCACKQAFDGDGFTVRALSRRLRDRSVSHRNRFSMAFCMGSQGT
jgi:hypothetical protein